MIAILLFSVALSTAITETALHYFPWRYFLHGKHELDRVPAYIFGVLGLFLAPTLLALTHALDGASVTAAYWVSATAGGLTVSGLYALDAHHALKDKHRADKRELDIHLEPGSLMAAPSK